RHTRFSRDWSSDVCSSDLVKLKDADLQPLYDEGELLPDTTDDDTAAAEETFADTEATNFKEMSIQEAKTALDGMKTGQKITLNKIGRASCREREEMTGAAR